MTFETSQTPNREHISDLIGKNLASRQYFYLKADEQWLDWLWQNGFLDIIKEADPTASGNRSPELGYLVRMAEKSPASVVTIHAQRASISGHTESRRS